MCANRTNFLPLPTKLRRLADAATERGILVDRSVLTDPRDTGPAADLPAGKYAWQTLRLLDVLDADGVLHQARPALSQRTHALVWVPDDTTIDPQGLLNSGFANAFRAREGHQLLTVDPLAAHLHALAELTADVNLIAALGSDDPYSWIAAELDCDRTTAKRTLFQWVSGRLPADSPLEVPLAGVLPDVGRYLHDGAAGMLHVHRLAADRVHDMFVDIAAEYAALGAVPVLLAGDTLVLEIPDHAAPETYLIVTRRFNDVSWPMHVSPGAQVVL